MIPHWILVGGITTPQDARMVEALGADAIAIVLTPGDPREVRLDMAAEIAASVTIEAVLEIKDPELEALREAVLTVEPTRLLVRGTPLGDEPPPLPWFRSFSCRGRSVLGDLKEYPGDRFLLEVAQELLPGEPAWQRDRALLREVGSLGAMVLGGVTSVDLLPAVLDKAQPWGIRLRSCVEHEPGWLDHAALERAMRILRGRPR